MAQQGDPDRVRPDAPEAEPNAPIPPGDADAIGRYDHVTRLPSRVPFLERLATSLRAIERDGVARTLILVTLAEAQHYNEILRALGHGFSEDFVRAGAARVAACIPSGTQLFNVSPLSFAFIRERDAAPGPKAVAEAIGRAFAEPVTIQAIPIQSRAGVGLVDLDPAVARPAESLRSALAAAQDSRRAQLPFADYNPGTDAQHQRAFRLLTDLPAALNAGDQLTLYLQPRVAPDTGVCVGAEALVRWHHPELGLILPGSFIPLVETTALIRTLTAYVLERALAQLRAWQDAGRVLRLSVNVAPANLAEPDFMPRLRNMLDRHGVAPENLELEFTEGTISPGDATTLTHLREARAMGIRVAIDDFGSGYSNMAYLTKIPADVVKIDKAFITALDGDPQCRFIARSIADLGHGLGFVVVGEGVESAWSMGYLRRIGCREAQGFHLCPPVPADAFEAWLDGGG